MKTLDRYLIREVLPPLSLSLLLEVVGTSVVDVVEPSLVVVEPSPVVGSVPVGRPVLAPSSPQPRAVEPTTAPIAWIARRRENRVRTARKYFFVIRRRDYRFASATD